MPVVRSGRSGSRAGAYRGTGRRHGRRPCPTAAPRVRGRASRRAGTCRPGSAGRRTGSRRISFELVDPVVGLQLAHELLDPATELRCCRTRSQSSQPRMLQQRVRSISSSRRAAWASTSACSIEHVPTPTASANPGDALDRLGTGPVRRAADSGRRVARALIRSGSTRRTLSTASQGGRGLRRLRLGAGHHWRRSRSAASAATRRACRRRPNRSSSQSAKTHHRTLVRRTYVRKRSRNRRSSLVPARRASRQ